MELDFKISEEVYNKYQNIIETNDFINRKTVSFQANKNEPFYSWLKYKEGFSTYLVEKFINKFAQKGQNILDPFSGAGTTLFTASENSINSTGIELLNPGFYFTEIRKSLYKIDVTKLKFIFNNIIDNLDDNFSKRTFDHITITNNAFPLITENLIHCYRYKLSSIEDENIKKLLDFVLFSILESISYTRKDGQYLRWDYRSGKNSKSTFDKGKILDFRDAITEKFNIILQDIENTNSIFNNRELVGNINNLLGSSLEILPKLESNSYDFLITSPPYCNRYDYTRTYALELVYLGITNEGIKDLRQEMLSCTVENKEKINKLRKIYSDLSKEEEFEKILEVISSSNILLETNKNLTVLNENNLLNNKNIPTMVNNYFTEMFFIIYEIARLLKSGSRAIIVNDNVRYGGCEIPVDLILCDFAESIGFEIEKIYVLPTGKGNSSQQMGLYGRSELRKCVYQWKKI